MIEALGEREDRHDTNEHEEPKGPSLAATLAFPGVNRLERV
jgi:hypothetical protein